MICYMPWLVACCLLLLLYSVRLRSGWSHGHGPRSYPVIGCLVAFYQNRFRLLDWYTELLAASPTQTIVVDRLGARRTVVTANPVNVEHILKGNFGNYPKGKPFTDILGDLLGTGIFNVDGELWYAQRKLVSHEFSARALRELEFAVLEDEARDRLVPALGLAAGRGDAVDMQDLLRRRRRVAVQVPRVPGRAPDVPRQGDGLRADEVRGQYRAPPVRARPRRRGPRAGVPAADDGAHGRRAQRDGEEQRGSDHRCSCGSRQQTRCSWSSQLIEHSSIQ
jgi:cytochrome P450